MAVQLAELGQEFIFGHLDVPGHLDVSGHRIFMHHILTRHGCGRAVVVHHFEARPSISRQASRIFSSASIAAIVPPISRNRIAASNCWRAYS